MEVRRGGKMSKDFCESLDKIFKKFAQPQPRYSLLPVKPTGDPNKDFPSPPPYDDFGDGKYDLMGVAKRIPLHAQKAEEFLAKGDKANAASHARAVISLGAQGYIGTDPYVRAQEVLRQLGLEVPQ